MSDRTAEQLAVDSFLAQGEMLAILTSHPAWPAFASLLKEMREQARNELEQCGPEDVRYWQGVSGTLSELMDRPARIVQAAGAKVEEEESEKQFVHTEVRAVLGMGADHDGEF